MSGFDSSIRSFIEEAGAGTPTPGGGSVAALAAALGASMVSMVSHFSSGPKFEQVQAEMKTLVAQMSTVIDECEVLLQADMDSFEHYMAALKLPRSTEEEKAVRTKKLQEASIKATEIPRQLIRLCQATLQRLGGVVDKVNKNVISDLGIGSLLLESAAQSAWLTVDMNLAGIKDTDYKEKCRQEVHMAMLEIIRIKDYVLTMTRQRICL